MQGFRVYFKAGSDNIELSIPDIYRDSDSETTTDQLRTYLANQLEKNYSDLEVDVKRGQKLKRKCDDYVLENEDEIYFYGSTSNKNIDVKRLKLQCGFSNPIESVYALKEYSETILDMILKPEEEHKTKAEDILRIFKAFLEKINDTDDRAFIAGLAITNYCSVHTSCYPFFQLDNKYYFCNRDKNKMPCGIGYMFDFDTLTYYQGQFQYHDNMKTNNIYYGKSICMSDDGYYTTCILYTDYLLSNNGFKKHFFRNEIYSGCFVDNLYGNLGCLTTNEGVYEGRFKNGMKSVIGSMKYANGDIYIGYWCEDKRSFHGKMYYKNNDHYIGTWYNDKREEFGSFYDSKMNITYVGTFKNDKRCFDDEEFKLYKGNYQSSIYTGAYEIELAKDTSGKKSMQIAKTCYENLLMMSCSSKNIPCDEFNRRQFFYTGNFDFSKNFYGYGKFFINPENTIIRNSTTCEDFSEGYIKEKFKGYHIYHGIFDDNKLNGFGMVTYRNGDRYVGDFKDNIQNGYGSMIKTDGTRYSGFWNFGRMVHRLAVNI